MIDEAQSFAFKANKIRKVKVVKKPDLKNQDKLEEGKFVENSNLRQIENENELNNNEIEIHFGDES